MGVLSFLTKHGLSIEADGDRLRVAPSHLLTEELRQFIHEKKDDLIAELKPQRWTVWRVCVSGRWFTLIDPTGRPQSEVVRGLRDRFGARLEGVQNG